MTPRTILYTGKGGVGKTGVAAATARRCAAAGLRTVVLSTDPAHSLSDSLETDLGGDPREIAPLLFGPGGDGAALGGRLGMARRPARGPRGGSDLGRGARRAARHGRTLLAAPDQA